MLLALDVGNTSITAGVFSGSRLVKRWRHETAAQKTPGGFARALTTAAGRTRGSIDAAVYGSVVPALDGILERAVRSAFDCRAKAVTPRSRLGMRLRVRHPSQVGADRLLNAVAAHALYGKPAVILDFGTALTFDCVSRGGDYLGGAILPGPRMAAQALAAGTAKLPLVAFRRPRRVIGKDTVECIQAGIYHGYLGMVEKVLALTLREMRAEGKPRLIATGGLARLLRAALPPGFIIAEDLTLQGLRIAHARLVV